MPQAFALYFVHPIFQYLLQPWLLTSGKQSWLEVQHCGKARETGQVEVLQQQVRVYDSTPVDSVASHGEATGQWTQIQVQSRSLFPREYRRGAPPDSLDRL